MIIKRWNAGTSQFVEEYPKTTSNNIYTANGSAQMFSSDKLLASYLPDSVFDNLKFQVAISASASNGTIADAILNARADAESVGNVQAVKGSYFVISTGGTITGLTNIQGAVDNVGIYATLQFKPQDGGSNSTANTSSGVLEVGDWFVIEGITGGNGTNGNPYVFVASVINNSYELATTAVDGVVRLSSRTTYASLSGDSVVTEGVLKTVIDNASFASSTHVHGNILNGGTITATVVTPADTDTILISDSSNSGKVERGITIGTGTTTFLRNDGTWGTPVGTTYTAGGGLSLAGTTFSHTDTSTASNLTATSRTYVSGLTFDTYGHVTGYTTATETVVDTNTTYTAGAGLSLVGTEFAHSDTSSVANSSNTNGTVIQSATFDTYGHVQSVSTTNLDGRYYTETEIDTELGKRKELYVQLSAPTTTQDGAIWFDI